MGIFNKKTKTPAVETTEPKVASAVAKVAKAPKGEPEFSRYSLQSVILGPVVSEKSARLHAQHQYVLLVSPRANKIEVQKALKVMYNVDTVSVNMLKTKGKIVRRSGREGKTADGKKAIVTLKKGQVISVFEGV